MCPSKRIFDKKHKAKGILYYEEAVSINDITFPKHNDRDKSQVGLAWQMEVEGDKPQQPKGEPDGDRIAQ